MLHMKPPISPMTLITATVCTGFSPRFKVGLVQPPADDPEEETENYDFLPHDSLILR